MPSKCDHEDNREKICGPCGYKIMVPKKKTLSSFKISNKCLDQIKRLLSPEYNVENPVYPKSICTNCRIHLSQVDKGQWLINFNISFLMLMPLHYETKNKCIVFPFHSLDL